MRIHFRRVEINKSDTWPWLKCEKREGKLGAAFRVRIFRRRGKTGQQYKWLENLTVCLELGSQKKLPLNHSGVCGIS